MRVAPLLTHIMKLNVEYDEKELAFIINYWFNDVNNRNPNFWNRNKVAKTIKFYLESWGYWKNKGGSPAGRRKAKRKMDWVLARRNGYEGDFEG